jgi:hypothetical protein
MTDSARALRAAIDDGPMSRFQVLAVCLCVALNMLDGYDVLVMAFTASEVAREWSLSGYALGVLLSAGLVGMAIGSLLVAPWADRYGRRAVILACLGVITFGMLLSALAQQPSQLKALRVLTGVGIGGILASLNVITSEYSSRRWRSAAIGIQVTGYPDRSDARRDGRGALDHVLRVALGVPVRRLLLGADGAGGRRRAAGVARLPDGAAAAGRAAAAEPSAEPHRAVRRSTSCPRRRRARTHPRETRSDVCSRGRPRARRC